MPGPLQSIAVGVIIAATLNAQSQPDDVDVLRVETRLVQVDVVVRDDDGPVSDLTVDDFRLFDDGVEQDIALFEVISIEGQPSADGIEPGVTGVVSNRPVSGPETLASATVLLIDRLNTGTLQQARATAQAVMFLESLDPRHQVAIYELGASLQLIHGYSNDRGRLIAALTGVDPEGSLQLEASTGPGITGGFEAQEGEIGLDPILAQMRANPGGGIESIGTLALDQEVALYYRESRIETTASVLEAIADQMAHLPGRKNLVWIAGSFPFTFDPYSYFPLREVGYDVKNRLAGTARAITDAGMAIYPISTHGIGATPAVETMNNIATATGGEAFYFTNGIAEAIQDAVDDTELVYTLGFYPGPSALDDGFHEFRIEVARDDVDVRHRRGYYGFGGETRISEENLGQLYRDLVTSPTNATAIGLFANTDPIDEGTEYMTTIAVDLNDLVLEYVDELWVGEVAVATVIVEAGDENAEIKVGTLTLRLTDEQYGVARESGYEIFRLRSYDRGAGSMRVVVRDPVSGAAGSLWVALD